jgi:Fe2+ transport system protein FeoA
MTPGARALCDLRVGEKARLGELRLDDRATDLLRALGLTSGCEIRVCKSGEPCIVQVGPARIGVSKQVAAGIWVVPVPSLQS